MSRSAPWLLAILGTLLLVSCGFFSLLAGTASLTPQTALRTIFDPGNADVTDAAVIWSIRMPRIIVAMLVGAALATVGAVMQALLRNSLADPGVTGVSAGAAVGAISAITLGVSGAISWTVPLSAFLGAAAIAGVLQLVLHFKRHIDTTSIILVGVSINSLAGALIHILIANATEDSLVRSAFFWLAGDLELRSWEHVWLAAVPVLAGVALLLLRAHSLNAFSLGEQIAATSGVSVARERALLLLLASLITGAAVAVSGIISFVGLVVPHAIRLLSGANHATLLPLSALGGAIFLVLADTLARTAFGAVVVQTGVVAALVGAPIFLLLLLRRHPA
ncbi:iron ABC transporter permease [Leucobacter sp. OH2974_COT-288]|nr:iron ABC transporter permease [Leucobacter sp. OH2974_COT-288]